MQIPLNVFDLGRIENGQMDELKQAGKVVFTRSAYLQSLVLMDPQNLPEKMAFVKPTRKSTRLYARLLPMPLAGYWIPEFGNLIG